MFYDHPPGLDGASGESWQAVEDGILDGADASPVAGPRRRDPPRAARRRRRLALRPGRRARRRRPAHRPRLRRRPPGAPRPTPPGCARWRPMRRGNLPAFAPATAAALRELVPATATIANPLDYTAMIWGDRVWQRDLVALVGEDPGIDHVLVFYDHPPSLDGDMGASWQAVEDGLLDGAEASPVPVLVAATLPELLDDAAAWRFAQAGVPAARRPPHRPRLRRRPPGARARCGAAARHRRRKPRPAAPGRRRARPSPVCELPSAGPLARRARDEGPPPRRRHPRRRRPHRRRRGRRRRRARRARRPGRGQALEPRAPAQDRRRRARARRRRRARRARRPPRARRPQRRRRGARGADGAARRRADRRRAPRRRRARARDRARRLYAEALDDVAVVPLPATPARVEAALRSLRGAAAARRRRPPRRRPPGGRAHRDPRPRADRVQPRPRPRTGRRRRRRRRQGDPRT